MLGCQLHKFQHEDGNRVDDYNAFEQETDQDNNRTRQSTIPAARKMTGNPDIGRGASAAPSVESEKIGEREPMVKCNRQIRARSEANFG